MERVVCLPLEIWVWIEATAERDGVTGDDLIAEAIALLAMADEASPRCRVCGCTDYRACAEGCCWAEDDLCSACAEPGREVVTVKVTAGIL